MSDPATAAASSIADAPVGTSLPSTEPVDYTALTDVPVIEFPAGMVGFPQAKHFVLVRADDVVEPVWYVLRCLEQPTLRFLVAQPALVFPDYAPEIDDATADRLGLDATTAEESALLLVVVTLGAKDEDATANLFAPLVLNRTTLQGAQAVLSGSGWSLREPLYS
jgi:flagellar assembly factor FliW